MAFEKEVLKSLVKKPVTIDYPRHSLPPTSLTRGCPYWNANRCVGCQRCARDCPAKAITIQGKPPNVNCDIDFGLCIFCGQCERSCPHNAMTISSSEAPPTTVRQSLKSHETQSINNVDNPSSQ